jgi:hypothetical protein
MLASLSWGGIYKYTANKRKSLELVCFTDFSIQRYKIKTENAREREGTLMNVFNDERDWPPMAQMRQIFTDCRQLSIISVNRYCLCHQWAIFHVYICRLGK